MKPMNPLILTTGYREVTLATVSAAVNGKSLPTLHPEVDKFVKMVYAEAGEKRDSYLTVSLDALSQQQINKARNALESIAVAVRIGDDDHIPYQVKEFYNLIPTKLPARIDKDALIKEFTANLAEQEERLNQLEAAIASNVAQTQQVDPESPLMALGGVTLKPMDSSSPAFGQIADFIERTSGQSKSIKSILQVKIPTERAAFEANEFGKSNVMSLFHGTKSWNLQHILRTGLIIPRHWTNGWRFGAGIYFADQARRSLNYTASRTGTRVLFITDVAVGTTNYMTGEDISLRQAPAGFHSTWGKQAYSQMDEVIVYRTSQQTIRAIVALD